jgi:hypothetical protein
MFLLVIDGITIFRRFAVADSLIVRFSYWSQFLSTVMRFLAPSCVSISASTLFSEIVLFNINTFCACFAKLKHVLLFFREDVLCIKRI